jgi:hypothetical protein
MTLPTWGNIGTAQSEWPLRIRSSYNLANAVPPKAVRWEKRDFLQSFA